MGTNSSFSTEPRLLCITEPGTEMFLTSDTELILTRCPILEAPILRGTDSRTSSPKSLTVPLDWIFEGLGLISLLEPPAEGPCFSFSNCFTNDFERDDIPSESSQDLSRHIQPSW
eukprot:gnl/MRDRNA2_/MRDRNA2_407451_c0_seq1.p1 gnl/MRDRNA2_/MRDRNA2_407451_c0~~gnl/MRDRNA2_/MRDRNA2_407451_c0_seq1.p1  ORF type:complete len:115 (-),score=8.98 gnl/MRDRNA2_/MRDRNA2_407451_c0_seq1:70-414(-)